MARITCPNTNSIEWKNLVRLYGETGAYKAFIANNYDIPSMNEDTTFDDIFSTEEEMLNPRNFQEMPFKFNMNRIISGEKNLTVRTVNYEDGTYNHQGNLFNVINQGRYNINTYLQVQGMTIEQFKKKFLGEDEIKYSHIKDFLDGKTDLWVYKLVPVNSMDDIITPVDDVRFQKTLQQKKRILTNLKTQLKGKLSDTRRRELKDRADKLQAQIDRLTDVDKRTFDTVVLNAVEDIELVNNLIASGITQKDVEYARSLLYGYQTVLAQFDVESEQDVDKLSQLLTVLQEMDKQLEKSTLTLGNRIVQEQVGKPVIINGTLIDSKDIKADTLYGFDTTKNENSIVQAITKLIKKASQTRDQVILQFQNKHEKIVKTFKQFQANAGLKGESIYDYMIQTYTSGPKKGQKSGLYVSEYTPEYYDALKENKSGHDKLKFLASNHTFEVDEEAWKIKQQNIRDYYNNKEINLTENQLKQRLTVEEVRTKLAEKAIAALNPYTMKKIFDKIGKDPKSLTAQDYEHFKRFEDRYGWREQGKQVLDKKPIDKWKDAKFAEIKKMSKDDPRRIFFEHFDEQIKAGRKELADDESYLPWNYIPERKKDLGMVKNFKQWWTDQVSQKIAQNIHGIDPITEEPLKQIPIFTISGKVRPEDKSYNLEAVLKAFVYETKNKKYMSEVEDDVKLLESLLQQQKVFETNPDGTPKTINGERVYKKKASNNYIQAQYRIAAQIYMERQEKEGITGKKMYDEVDKDRMAHLKSEINALGFTDEQKRNLNQYLGKPEMGTNENEKKYIEAATELREIEGRFKNVTITKAVNFARLWTSIKLLGLNVFGGITEIMQGIGSLMIEGAAGEFFTSKQGLEGLGEMIKQLGRPESDPTRQKISRLSQLFKVEGEISYGEEKNAITNVAYYQYKLAKLFVNNGFLIAMLKNEKIKDKEGNEHSLYDVMSIDEDLLITLPDNFDNPYTKFNEQGDIEITEASFKLQQKFREIIKSNRDRDSSEDPILADKTAIGRILGQFKASWMFEAFNKRFGRERAEDIYTSKSSKGFYRSVKDAFLKQVQYTDDLGETQYRTKFDVLQGAKALWQFSFFQKYGKDGYQGELSELDQANLKRFLREMTLIVMVTTSVAIFSSMGGDDDEDYVKNKSLNYLINQGIRIQRDLTTYMSPSSFASIMRNPAPVVSTLVDFTKIASATISTALGDPYSYEGTSREFLKLPRAIEQATPGARQIRSLMNKFDKQIDYTRD